mmetsp:Transcript_35069/g.49051  ORF Transcript_35069/g.49051 Transcript_35069/m.49051 type:complete len:300 (-) Transcript_35069:63-962(-)
MTMIQENMDGNHISLHALLTDIHLLQNKVLRYEKALNLLEHHGISQCVAINAIKLHNNWTSVANDAERGQNHDQILVDMNLLCQGFVKLQAEKAVETAVKMSQGCGRVSQKGLEVALKQHFDPTSANRLLVFIQSVYGAPICDDELKEWVSMDESILMQIIVHASTRKTRQTTVDVISKNDSIRKSSLKLASHLKAILQNSSERKQPVNQKRVHFATKGVTQVPQISNFPLSSKCEEEHDNGRLGARQETPHKPKSRHIIGSIGGCNDGSNRVGARSGSSSESGSSSSSSSSTEGGSGG